MLVGPNNSRTVAPANQAVGIEDDVRPAVVRINLEFAVGGAKEPRPAVGRSLMDIASVVSDGLHGEGRAERFYAGVPRLLCRKSRLRDSPRAKVRARASAPNMPAWVMQRLLPLHKYLVAPLLRRAQRDVHPAPLQSGVPRRLHSRGHDGLTCPQLSRLRLTHALASCGGICYNTSKFIWKLAGLGQMHNEV